LEDCWAAQAALQPEGLKSPTSVGDLGGPQHCAIEITLLGAALRRRACARQPGYQLILDTRFGFQEINIRLPPPNASWQPDHFLPGL